MSFLASDKEKPLLEPAEDTGDFGNPYFRWTVLYAGVIFVLTLMPLWLSVIIPNQIAVVVALIMLFFCAIWVAIGCNALRNFSKLHTTSVPSLAATHAARERQFTHLVIVPCYIDPIEVLFDALGSLLLQADPTTLHVVVAFEAKTPDLLLKENTVRSAFADKFGGFQITIHEVTSKEIPGGCSNKNYALRQATKHFASMPMVYAHRAITVTTCDTDSLFHPNYFTVLENEYNTMNPVIGAPPAMCVWQSPLFYNWDLDERPFFNRITGLMRSMMMLGGLISFNLNPMSIFSYPIELGLKAGFINPRYGVDDIIAKVRWMCTTNTSVPVLLLPIPSISGPTIGVTFWNEVDEWARQIRRWIVGSSESFHYFVIHWRGVPMWSGLWWFFMFFMYYAVLLCCAGIFTFLAGIPLPWVHYPTLHFHGQEFSLRYTTLVILAIQYVVFGIAFIIDAYATKLMTVKENISIFRNIAHWLLSPWVLLAYSCVAFYAIVTFVCIGKPMARHDMAAKEGLMATAEVAKRSTSVSRETTSNQSNAGAKANKHGVLINLPSRFYFGEYSASLADIRKQMARNRLPSIREDA